MAILEDVMSGSSIQNACRRRHLTPQTFYRWSYGMIERTMKGLQRRRDVEEENRRLKRRIAELSLDYNMLRAALINEPYGEC